MNLSEEVDLEDCILYMITHVYWGKMDNLTACLGCFEEHDAHMECVRVMKMSSKIG